MVVQNVWIKRKPFPMEILSAQQLFFLHYTRALQSQSSESVSAQVTGVLPFCFECINAFLDVFFKSKRDVDFRKF